jgi:amino acid/amide ABC transporter ATP-binding protein 2, HAAT family (TC 3.A.1.4.-)
MLKVDKVNVLHGKLQAIWDVSLEVGDHEFVTIIGPNGAGKTTLLMAISGVIKPSSGLIEFQGKRLDGLPPHKICERNIIQVPEGRKIFPLMKVSENLEMGAYLPETRKSAKDSMEQVYQLFPILKERQNQLAGTLSGGEQQVLALARGLMSQPKLLMLDEPSLGLSPKLAMEMLSILKRLHEQGIAILLVSQEVLRSLKVTQRAYVLENGRIAMEGSGEELLQNKDIRKSYLGL